jgi:hypothetical protein
MTITSESLTENLTQPNGTIREKSNFHVLVLTTVFFGVL